MVNGGRVGHWACINFSRNVQDNAAKVFCHELAIMCQISGMVWFNHATSFSYFFAALVILYSVVTHFSFSMS
jgi:hypothetical protein